MPRSLLISLALAVGAVSAVIPRASAATSFTTSFATAGDPVVVAAGDIACDPGNAAFNHGVGRGQNCRARAVARLISSATPTSVLTLGDNQYDEGLLRAYRDSYEKSWGPFLPITRPAPGNHEYESGSPDGYFDYFGTAAGPPGKGYYSYDLGAWHLVALNSNCWVVDCGKGSDQYAWLKADLRSSSATCTLAYWHHPRFSSGPHGDAGFVAPFWRLLYGSGADVVLNGHDHIYERFAPLTPAGDVDRTSGVREFVVGTGGAQHYWIDHVQPHSQVRNVDTFGVLQLTLHDGSYDWSFLPQAGRAFTDTGSDACH